VRRAFQRRLPRRVALRLNGVRSRRAHRLQWNRLSYVTPEAVRCQALRRWAVYACSARTWKERAGADRRRGAARRDGQRADKRGARVVATVARDRCDTPTRTSPTQTVRTRREDAMLAGTLRRPCERAQCHGSVCVGDEHDGFRRSNSSVRDGWRPSEGSTLRSTLAARSPAHPREEVRGERGARAGGAQRMTDPVAVYEQESGRSSKTSRGDCIGEHVEQSQGRGAHHRRDGPRVGCPVRPTLPGVKKTRSTRP
jgi:hypothetical protein